VVLERARNPLWAVLESAPPDNESVTAEDIAAIEEGRRHSGISVEEFRAETAWSASAVRPAARGRQGRCAASLNPIAHASSMHRSAARGRCEALDRVPGVYRLRVGTWRVLFELADGDVIVVYRIAPRGSAYQP